MNVCTREKEYGNFKKQAKKGCQKYAGLSLKGMKKYAKKYEDKTGKNPYKPNNKEHFYKFVARNKLRKR